MNHDWVLERLSPYIDDELPPDESSRVSSHIETCDSCGAVLAQLQSLSAGVRNLERTGMPDDLKADLTRRARAAGQPAQRTWRPWAFGTMAAAAAVLLIVVVRTPSSPEAPGTPLPESLPTTVFSDEARENKPAPVKGPADTADADDTEALKKSDLLEALGYLAESNEAAIAVEEQTELDTPAFKQSKDRVDKLEESGGRQQRSYRFTSRLVRTDNGLSLGPLSAVDARPRRSVVSPAAPPEEKESSEAATGGRLVLIASTDKEGRIITAAPVGAMTLSTATVDLIKDELIGRILPGETAGTRVTVEVTFVEAL